MTLTHEDLQTLAQPFEVDEHEWLNGNAYITEAAILNRIESIDPCWEGRKTEVVVRTNESGQSITVFYALTIKGVTRESNGSAVVVVSSKGKEANEAEKSALTDAIKRAARLFGIGRYILSFPSNVKDANSLAKYLGGSTSVQHKDTPISTNDSKLPWTQDRSKVAAFFEMAKTDFDMPPDFVLEILNKHQGTNHKKFNLFGDSLSSQQAAAVIVAQGCNHDNNNIDIHISQKPKEQAAYWQKVGELAKEIF